MVLYCMVWYGNDRDVDVDIDIDIDYDDDDRRGNIHIVYCNMVYYTMLR